MTSESLCWFSVQVVATGLAFWGGRRIGKRPGNAWKIVAVASILVMFAWPVMRFLPGQALRLLGSGVVIFIDVTGVIVPASLMFSIAACQVPRPSTRRALNMLLAVCGLYLVQTGKWMVRDSVPDLGKTLYAADEVCLQTTNYTCVAASLVTMLKHYGIEAEETEMARLSHTEKDRGTTDSRAVFALERKLAGEGFEIRYDAMTFEELCEAKMPCVVSVKWGFLINHMVPVLSADEKEVWVGDPLTGRRRYEADAFESIWKGAGIYLERSRRAFGSERGEQENR